MKFHKTSISNVYLVEIECIADDRGFFARTFCHKEFLLHGLHSHFVQCNTSSNRRRGTLRGLHFQEEPFAEEKLIRCTSGAIYDVVVDLREHSSTYCQWISRELTSKNGHMLYIPEGCAHGFQTLEDNTEVFYQMTHEFVPSAAKGVRWDDPVFAIQWPLPVVAISPKDQQYPLFQPQKTKGCF